MIVSVWSGTVHCWALYAWSTVLCSSIWCSPIGGSAGQRGTIRMLPTSEDMQCRLPRCALPPPTGTAADGRQRPGIARLGRMWPAGKPPAWRRSRGRVWTRSQDAKAS
jgi:hypothetical protein